MAWNRFDPNGTKFIRNPEDQAPQEEVEQPVIEAPKPKSRFLRNKQPEPEPEPVAEDVVEISDDSSENVEEIPAEEVVIEDVSEVAETVVDEDNPPPKIRKKY